MMLKNSKATLWRIRWWSLLSILLCFHCSLHVNLQSQNTESNNCNLTSMTELRLLTMLPYRDEAEAYNPSWDQGLDILPALDLAAEQINNSSNILPCHQLELFHVDGGCDIVPKTSLGIVNVLFGSPDNENVTGAVGLDSWLHSTIRRPLSSPNGRGRLASHSHPLRKYSSLLSLYYGEFCRQSCKGRCENLISGRCLSNLLPH